MRVTVKAAEYLGTGSPLLDGSRVTLTVDMTLGEAAGQAAGVFDGSSKSADELEDLAAARRLFRLGLRASTEG